MEFTGSDLHILKYRALYGKNLSLQQLERNYALRARKKLVILFLVLLH
jgi:hypothetical protein